MRREMAFGQCDNSGRLHRVVITGGWSNQAASVSLYVTQVRGRHTGETQRTREEE